MAQQATKEKILLATIDAIEKNGIHNITTRVIADEAGVNNAALHYYYGTKEQLVEAALLQTTEHWIEDTSEILSSDKPVRERIREMLVYLIDGVLRYPNLIRAHIQGPFMEGNPNSSFLRMLSNWLEQTANDLGAEITPEQEQVVHVAMQTAISSILIVGLVPASPDLKVGIHLKDDNTREVYTTYLVDSILNAIGEESE